MTARHLPDVHLLANRLLSSSAGLIALLVVVWASSQLPPTGLPWLDLVAWIALYTSARLLTFNLLGAEFTFGHILLLAAFLSFDLTLALWMGCAGIVIEQVVRTLTRARRRLEPGSIWAALARIGLALARIVFSLTLAALAFKSAGGHAPLIDVNLPDVWPFTALFGVYAAVTLLIHLVFASFEARASLLEWSRQNVQHLLLVIPLLLLLPLAIVIALHYLRTSFALFTSFSVLLILFMVMIYNLSAARATLEKRLRERASVSAVGQAITTSLDLPELLEAIHRQIGALMDARNFYFALYNEDYDELSFPLVYEDGQPARYRSRSMRNGLTEYVLRTRTPLLLPADVASVIRRLGLEAAPGREARSWLGVPITIGDRALGVITVQSLDRSNAYGLDDLELLLTLAAHTAVAIENAQLYASMRRRAAELAILNSVSTVVGSSLNLDQVMQAIITSVGPVVGCQKAAILLVQEGGRSLAPAAARGLAPAFLDQLPAMMRLARGEVSLASVERQPLIVNDVHSDPRLENFRELAETERIRAFADMPLQAREHIIGTLTVCYTEPHRFTIAELDLITTFANQAAVAVSNAALYAQTDQALTRRVEELAALEAIGRELGSTLDFNRVIERVLDTAIESAGATRGLVALYDTERHALNLVAARGYPPGTLARADIEHWPADQGAIGGALRDRTAVWIDDVHESHLYTANDPTIRAALVVPILREGAPLGVINLESTRREVFNAATAAFIGQLATQAAVSIRNAQLYQVSQNRLREMSILFELSRQVTSMILDLPELGRELTRQLAQALNTSHCTLELIAGSANQLESIAEYAAPGTDPIALPPPQSGVLHAIDLDELRRSRQPAILYASDLLERADDEFLHTRQLYALLALPLIAGNEVIGRIVWLHSSPRLHFSTDEIRLAQTLANQAGVAVENARLFHERARRINDLAQLYQASLALAASIEFDEALSRIALIAREITDSDSVTVFLYDAGTDQITHGSQLAGPDNLFDPSAVRPHGMTRRVIRTHQPVLLNDTLHEPDMNPRVLEAGFRSMIGMPIMRKDQVVGVLYVNSRTPGKYTADSLQLVQLLANEAAVTIENAQLFSQVAEARDRLAAILNSSRDGVLMFDVSGCVVVANPMLEQLWGIHRRDLEGQSLVQLLDAPELELAARLGYTPRALRALLGQATAGVQVQWGKEVFTLSGGARPRSIERSGLPVQDEHGGLVGWMIVLRDVTEERELQQMREDLSNMIVHDLRSPLVAILDSYELIGEALPPLTLGVLAGPALDVGQRSTRKLLDLVNSLLDISRFEHGHASIDTQFAALRPLAENAFEQLAPMLADRGLTVRNEVSDELPLVKVDEDQITRVLINLIDNAAKFSPASGQVIVSARLETDGADVTTHVIVCSVRDMGPGIPLEHRERIFERFVQLSEGLERRRGTGLGLAFCKMAIEAHGGSIWVEDPPDGRGSQFSFTLPVAILLPSPL
ncbi:MAG TPA: GAF domain-containing protein [Anaerolineae bacterium]|nr:GAF domain-containing protein [Anaerolineae bacterium]